MNPIRLLHLYPDRMSIYGDYGNILALTQRMAWRNIAYEYNTYTIGDKLRGDYDIVFIGGGQDKGQQYVAQDLQTCAHYLHDHYRSDKPILAICGGYQLFGQYFITNEGVELPGIHIFDIVTKAGEQRMIGNIVIENERLGKLVGFENHSGETELLGTAKPLGKVLKGYGNNTSSQTEGVWMKSAIGTYMHGSFLPKNPSVADYLLTQAIRAYKSDYKLSHLDDTLEHQSADIATTLK